MDLASNYPNPFNASTIVQFTMAESGQAELTIYNVLGQKVRQLWSGVLREGDHRLEWDGRNDSGHPVPSGMYFYRLVSEGRQITKKMVVVK